VTQAPAAVAPRTVPDSPYVGLAYYTVDRAEFFFGRAAERRRIIGNLRASKLTLLYAQSGVGKSSLLRAGVTARLLELADQNFTERSSVHYLPVVFSTWIGDPVGGLIDAIRSAIRPYCADGRDVDLPGGSLEEAIDKATERLNATLLLILDQFEEYFLYTAKEEDGDPGFADQLAACVNRPDLRTNVLIAIREDAYAWLSDAFKGRIANLYGNYLHLEYLDLNAAREAIVKPIDIFNLQHPGEEPIRIEPQLVDTVIDQVTRGKIVLGEAGRGSVDGTASKRERSFVETPYLQLVMERLWEAELTVGSHTLRLATFERLGQATTIIGTHLDKSMAALPPGQQDVAAAVFRYLVTPSGTKIALSVSDLAEFAEVPPDELQSVIERLTQGDFRILRPVPRGESGHTQYEILHDALARPILDWRTRHAQQRALEQERRRARRFRRAMIASIATAVIAGAIAASFVLLVAAPRAFVTVPAVNGLRLVTAAKAIENAHLTFHATIPVGVNRNAATIAAQSPAARTKVAEGTIVILLVDTRVPNVIGLSLVAADEAIRRAGLRSVLPVLPPRVNPTTVTIQSQIPVAGAVVTQGSTVVVFVPPLAKTRH
jgi:hypothetical protein